MDYAAIATAVYTFVAPFVAKGVEKGIEKLGEKSAEEGFNERKAIWERVKGLFKEDDLTLLNLFEEAEKDTEKKIELKGELKGYLKTNPEITTELDELVRKLEAIQKRNVLNLISEDIKGGSEISNEIDQSTQFASENKASITSKNIDNSKITNKITQK